MEAPKAVSQKILLVPSPHAQSRGPQRAPEICCGIIFRPDIDLVPGGQLSQMVFLAVLLFLLSCCVRLHFSHVLGKTSFVITIIFVYVIIITTIPSLPLSFG